MKDVIQTAGRYLLGFLALHVILCGLAGLIFAISCVGAGFGVALCLVAGIPGPSYIPLVFGGIFAGTAIALAVFATFDGE